MLLFTSISCIFMISAIAPSSMNATSSVGNDSEQVAMKTKKDIQPKSIHLGYMQ